MTELYQQKTDHVLITYLSVSISTNIQKYRVNCVTIYITNTPVGIS